MLIHPAHPIYIQTKYDVSDLDGLSEAALPQHLSMDEVRWAENAVRLIGHNTERLRSIDVFPLGDGG